MSCRASRRRIRATPTVPNSPREIMLGEVAPIGPIQSEIASKSNVKQTVVGIAFPPFHASSRAMQPRVLVHRPLVSLPARHHRTTEYRCPFAPYPW